MITLPSMVWNRALTGNSNLAPDGRSSMAWLARIWSKTPARMSDSSMLHYTLVFLVVAIIAAVLGFTGIAGAAAGIAKILFLVFLVLFVASLIFGRRKTV